MGAGSHAPKPCPPLPLRRYGFLGSNGCGKSCLLKAIAAREVPVPDHVDIYMVDREIAGSDMTALEAVMSVDEEKVGGGGAGGWGPRGQPYDGAGGSRECG